MLAVATAILYFMGPTVIGYIPVMVVGSLIFHLGLELMKESLVDTWGVVHPLEYVTIALIVVAMAFWGFIEVNLAISEADTPLRMSMLRLTKSILYSIGDLPWNSPGLSVLRVQQCTEESHTLFVYRTDCKVYCATHRTPAAIFARRWYPDPNFAASRIHVFWYCRPIGEGHSEQIR